MQPNCPLDLTKFWFNIELWSQILWSTSFLRNVQKSFKKQHFFNTIFRRLTNLWISGSVLDFSAKGRLFESYPFRKCRSANVVPQMFFRICRPVVWRDTLDFLLFLALGEMGYMYPPPSSVRPCSIVYFSFFAIFGCLQIITQNDNPMFP